MSDARTPPNPAQNAKKGPHGLTREIPITTRLPPFLWCREGNLNSYDVTRTPLKRAHADKNLILLANTGPFTLISTPLSVYPHTSLESQVKDCYNAICLDVRARNSVFY